MSTTELQLPDAPTPNARDIATPPTPRHPLVKIRPPAGWSPLALAELWHYRDLLTALAVRDVRIRYKQTALGILWVVLQPLMNALIFAFIFGFLAKIPTDGADILLFFFAGNLGWTAFNSTLAKASDCVVGNSQLVSKVYFPRLILPLSTILSTLIDFGVAILLLAAMMAWKGVHPGLNLLLLPVALALLLLLAIGLGLYTSALMVTYRDLKHVIPVVVQLLMWVTPINYPLSLVRDKVPPAWQPLYFLNPLVELMQVFRWSLLGTGEVNAGWFAYSAVMVVILFIFGTFAFKRMERRFADVI